MRVAKSLKNSDETEPIGLLAAWGNYPVVVAQELRQRGHRVICAAVRDHADPELAKHCDELFWVGMGSIGGIIRRFRQRGVRRAVMAGKIHKVTFYRPAWWLRHSPDLTAVRTFYRHFVSGAKDRKDDSLLLAVVGAFQDSGITFEPATDYAPQVLVAAGQVAGRPLSVKQLRDVDFGWELAKAMGGLDVGQTVCVKDQAVLAVEAIEGTDLCIRRAGELCRQGGFTVVKVAKPEQDMRFDVPTVGLGTLQSISSAGGSVLAIEADATILLDSQEFQAAAKRFRISVVAMHRRPPLSQVA
jgi:UDP-2,3-diacylglucosamine hydrolase